MAFQEEEFLLLSGLQHFAFCRRQWALIHIEGLWQENLRTVEGDIFHKRAHNETERERRGEKLILRGLPLKSYSLGISGKCDVVEFYADSNGAFLYGETGRWHPFPIEYKKGSPKAENFDALQLCAEAMCLEEMFCCSIDKGALYYGETRRREEVSFTKELREQVKQNLEEMHRLFKSGYTPKVKPTKSCNACSLKEVCLPALMRKTSAADYLKRAVEEET